jgi:hypothetical protein
MKMNDPTIMRLSETDLSASFQEIESAGTGTLTEDRLVRSTALPGISKAQYAMPPRRSMPGCLKMRGIRPGNRGATGLMFGESNLRPMSATRWPCRTTRCRQQRRSVITATGSDRTRFSKDLPCWAGSTDEDWRIQHRAQEDVREEMGHWISGLSSSPPMPSGKQPAICSEPFRLAPETLMAGRARRFNRSPPQQNTRRCVVILKLQPGQYLLPVRAGGAG